MTIRGDDRILVTGAASGLGLALVRQLVRRGCRVLATDLAERRPDSLDDAPSVVYRGLDVRSDDDWQAAHDWVRREWHGLDILMNNAGVAAGGRIELTTMDQWQWIVDINLFGVVRGCRTFAPMLKAQRTGHIVNTASAAGLVHPPRMAEYTSVKAGVVALSETLRYELEPYGVTVSVVCPTFFRTNLAASLRGHDPDSKRAAQKLIESSPLSADTVAARVVGGVDQRRHLILTDRNGRLAYYAKRFARPLYDLAMTRQAQAVAGKHPGCGFAMTLIVLVRHGQASWGQADYDVLSEHGHTQARTLGDSWRTAGFAPTRLVTGSMRRHVETAAGVQQGLGSALDADVIAGLEEFDHVDVFAESLAADGSLPETDEASMEEMFDQGLHSWIAADGSRTYRETYVQFRTRVRDAFDSLRTDLEPDDKAVVVTSGGVIAGIVCDLLGVDAERWPVLAGPIVNSSTHKILVRAGRAMLVSFNEHSHLAAEDITYA